MWTKELPTSPGYYRLRNYVLNGIDDADEGPSIVLIAHDDNDPDLPLEVRWPGSELNAALSDFLSAEWHGPLSLE